MNIVIILALLSALNANVYGTAHALLAGSARLRTARTRGHLNTRRAARRSSDLGAVRFHRGGVELPVARNHPEHHAQRDRFHVPGGLGLALISQIILRKRADRAGAESPLKMWLFPWLSYFAPALLAAIIVLGLFDSAVRFQLIATFILVCLIALACKVLIKPRPDSVSADDAARAPNARPARNTQALRNRSVAPDPTREIRSRSALLATGSRGD